MTRASLVLLAGGSGTRLGAGKAKALVELGGEPLYVKAARPFLKLPQVKEIILVVPKGERHRFEQYLSGRKAGSNLARRGLMLKVVEGGKERQHSARNGLEATSEESHVILFHDAARALVHPEDVAAVLQAAAQHGAAVLAHPLTDTVKRATPEGFVHETLPRHELWAVSTPQGLKRPLALRAHEEAARHAYLATDDVSLAEKLGHPVKLVPARHPNPKITYAHDVHAAEGLLRARREAERK